MYTDYIREFQSMVSVLDETRQRNPEFDKIVTDFEVDANRLDGCIVWNTHSTVFGSKRLAISDTWFIEPTRVLNARGISIASAVFAGLTSVTDRQTDHATWSVTTGHIYIRRTVMPTNNRLVSMLLSSNRTRKL